MERPTLDAAISVKDFTDFYWLKKELTDFCRKSGLSTSGGKIEIAQRIIDFLTTSTSAPVAPPKKVRPQSIFNWNDQSLTSSTLITDNYKSTENVRAFFIREIGSHFSFNVSFMRWLKENSGKTLADAIQEWQRLHELKKDKKYMLPIAPQFEYNRYMRAFLTDNPSLTARDAMKFWKLKSAKRGTNEYEKTDSELT